MLYTAHYPGPFDKAAPQSGLLRRRVDGGRPGRDGDRPASRSTTTGPTPSRRRRCCSSCRPSAAGTWRWDDLVAALHETLDLARQRAVEPAAIDGTAYAQLLPATVMAATVRQVSISTNLAVNNGLFEYLAED